PLHSPTLSLHDALPISRTGACVESRGEGRAPRGARAGLWCSTTSRGPSRRSARRRGEASASGRDRVPCSPGASLVAAIFGVSARSEEHTSELQSRENLV